MNRILIIAGESSGDIHGSQVVKQLKFKNRDLEIYGIGGDEMQKEGMEIVQHINTISLVGFVEVILHLRKFLLLKDKIVELLKFRRPDVILLIDYPGFNFKIAKEAKKLNIPVAYYISPQIWAWKQKRIEILKKLVNKMFVVFPFEEKLFKDKNISVEFVGHPLLEELPQNFNKRTFLKNYNLSEQKPIITLLPGSRKQEIEKMFPVMVLTIKEFLKNHDAQILVGVAGTIDANPLKKMCAEIPEIIFLEGDTHAAMQASDAVIVTSGTATLETALFGIPMVVLYKLSILTYWIAKFVVKIPHISLVNILAGKEVVKELIQNELHPELILEELKRIIDDKNYRSEMQKNLHQIKSQLGTPGASIKVANGLFKIAENLK